MNIIACCSATNVLKRWEDSLQSTYTMYQATTLKDLKILLQKISYEVILLHNMMIEPETVARLRQALPTIRIFILSDRPTDEEGLDYLKKGVVGYANSYINKKRFLEAVGAITSGSVWVNQTLMQRLIAGALPATEQKPAEEKEQEEAEELKHLSNREYQIAALVADGLSNLEIAAELDITERTVKAHLSSIYAKTNSRGRLNLALLFKKK